MSGAELLLVLPDVPAAYLRKDLAYLQDKGLIECPNMQPNLAWEKRKFKLTAQGVETADKIIRDPALEP